MVPYASTARCALVVFSVWQGKKKSSSHACSLNQLSFRGADCFHVLGWGNASKPSRSSCHSWSVASRGEKHKFEDAFCGGLWWHDVTERKELTEPTEYRVNRLSAGIVRLTSPTQLEALPTLSLICSAATQRHSIDGWFLAGTALQSLNMDNLKDETVNSSLLTFFFYLY